MCGVTMVFGLCSSGWSVGSGGSVSNTSQAAPAISPRSSASASATESTTPPRAVLMRIACRCICASCSRPIMPRVCSVSGQCSETISARCSSSSSETCASMAGSETALRLKASTLQPKALHSAATRLPIAPAPTMPTVLPHSRLPTRPSFVPPLRQRSWVLSTLRSRWIMKLMHSSATACVA